MYIKINNNKINVIKYSNFKDKLLGLMLKKNKIKDIYLFDKCNSIHTFFMKQNIDLCMLDKNNKIIYLKETLKPNKIIIKNRSNKVLEMPLKTSKYLKLNTKLKIEE